MFEKDKKFNLNRYIIHVCVHVAIWVIFCKSHNFTTHVGWIIAVLEFHKLDKQWLPLAVLFFLKWLLWIYITKFSISLTIDKYIFSIYFNILELNCIRNLNSNLNRVFILCYLLIFINQSHVCFWRLMSVFISDS